MGLFEIKTSTHSTNSTAEGRGIIPGILYTFWWWWWWKCLL